MGKIATGFRDLRELEKWDYSGQEVHTCYGLKYVWILCEVNCFVREFKKNRKGEWVTTGNLDCITVVEPCRFFLLNRKPTLADNFGDDRSRVIVSWRPVPQLLGK